MTSKRRIFLIILLIFIILIIPFSIIYTEEINNITPHVYNGQADFSESVFDTTTTFPLNGNWEITWFDNDTSDTSVVKVPGPWQLDNSNPDIKDFGYGIYHLNILLPNTSSNTYGIKFKSIQSAYNIYIDDKLVFSNSTPTFHAETTTSYQSPATIFFETNNNVIELKVEVANYATLIGGINHSVRIGSQQAIQSLDIRQKAMDVFLISLYFTLFIFMLIFTLNAFTKRNNVVLSSLIAVIFLCSLMVLTTTSEQFIFMFFPNITQIILIRLQFIFAFTNGYFIVLLFHVISDRSLPKLYINTAHIAHAFSILLAFILPITYIKTLRLGYLFIGTVAFIFLVYYMITTLKKGIYNSLPYESIVSLYLGLVFILLYYLFENVYFYSIIDTKLTSYYFLCLFPIFMSITATNQFANKYAEAVSSSTEMIEIGKLKDEFLDHTSNELLSPLNTIDHLSKEIIMDQSTIAIEDFINRQILIQNTTKRLMRVVHNLVDYSSLQKKSLVLNTNKTNFIGFIDTFVYIIETEQNDFSVNIESNNTNSQMYTNIDLERTLQSLSSMSSFLSNYTQSKIITLHIDATTSDILLSLDSLENTLNDSTFNSIQDILNRPNEAIYIYEGIEFSIARDLFNHMNGTLNISRINFNKGVRFMISLPYETDSSSLSEKATSELQSISKINIPLYTEATKSDGNILIIDNNVSNLTTLASMLQSDGYKCYYANTSHDLTDYIYRLDHFNTIIIESILPQNYAYDLCQEARKFYTVLELPILLTSSTLNESIIKKCANVGANDILVRPYTSIILRERVNFYAKSKTNQQLLLDTQMAYLFSQIKPHFLYNALNSISALCLIEPLKASELTDDLCIYLRKLLQPTKTDTLVNLSSEIELVDAYVKIEKARFNNKFNVIKNIHTNNDFLLPSVIIQPIVENAIKHGLAKYDYTGTININITEDLDYFNIEITDNGCGMSTIELIELNEHEINTNTQKTSIGIHNVRSRLKTLYDSDLQIESTLHRGTNISFKIPKEGITND